MNVRFILNEPRNPKNIGAAARGMANFGFRKLVVVNPYSQAWRETRSAVNASAVVLKAKKYDSLKQAVRSTSLVIGTSAGSRRTRDTRWIGLEKLKPLIERHKSVAVIFGSERSGLSNEDLALCHYIVRIPTAPSCPSMNLSQAVAVLAYAIRPQPTASTVASPKQVPMVHVERLIERALKAYTDAGLLKGWDPRRAEQRVRKAFHRWQLNEDDIALLHGIFRWVLKKT